MDKVSSPEKLYPPGKGGIMAAATPPVMLAVATIVAFVNAWPNTLVFDDKAFAGPARAPQLDNLHFIFTHELWATVGAHTGLYRPLLLLNLSLETRLFGDWLAGYHLSSIFLHLLATLLVYGFLRYLMRRNSDSSASSDLYAVLAALVFAVHPIHTEVINSVFNRSEILVTVFGLVGLWWLLFHVDDRAARAWIGLAVTYFLGLLSKESAVMIPGLAVVLILLLTSGDLIERIRKCLPAFWLILPLALYLAMRTYALSQPVTGDAGEGLEFESMFTTIVLPDANVVLRVIGIFGDSLRVIAWPYPLKLYYPKPPALILLCYAVLNLSLIIAAFVQAKRSRPGLAAGLAFFYVAMLPASRLIGTGESGPQFAERYVYFPSVGLAIALAFTLGALARRFTARALVLIAMPVLLLLTALTWERNADWTSEISLFETEYARGHRGPSSLRLLASAYLKAKNYARIVQVCDENVETQEKAGDSSFVEYCATAYEHERRLDEAERAHLFAIKEEDTRIAASLSLARFYIRHDRRQDAEKSFTAAIDWSDDPAARALYRAEMIIALNSKSRKQGIIAKGYLEEALRLRPGWPKAERMLMAVERALDSSANTQDSRDN